MHTQARFSGHNDRLIKFCLEKCYPDGIITVERLIEDNLVNGTQVAELAVCRTNGNVEMCSIGIGRDLTDDSDVKTVTVQEARKKTWLVKNKIRTGEFNISLSHRTKIKDVHHKIGKLRVICYNPFHEQWKYFVIPNDFFANIKQLCITFERSSGEPLGIYKQFEVPTWEDMCNL